jgi:integrase
MTDTIAGLLARARLSPWAGEGSNLRPTDYEISHALRHTLGSLIEKRLDKSDRELADLLGHYDPAFSKRVYTSSLNDRGDMTFLDELIPVPASDGG